MSRTHHPRKSYNKRELNDPKGGYLPPGRFNKTRLRRLARRVPPLALEDYEWPTQAERDAQDECDEISEYYAELWIDESIFGPPEADDFDDFGPPEHGYLDDFEVWE